MTGNRVALDTNHAIHVLNDVPAVIAWLNAFEELCLPVPVIGELLYGALNSARAAENLVKVHTLAGRCRILTSDIATSRAYAEIGLALKSRGRPVPENDIWIAAACIEHDVALATDDGYFSQVANLKTLKAP
jgi:tRNA(fMet)-specific endonuclease VapC